MRGTRGGWIIFPSAQEALELGRIGELFFQGRNNHQRRWVIQTAVTGSLKSPVVARIISITGKIDTIEASRTKQANDSTRLSNERCIFLFMRSR